MKRIYLLFIIGISFSLLAQTTKTDGDWSQQYMFLKNTTESEYMIRLGDIDNLGYGWEDGFNPFSGRSTNSHDWPYNINPNDVPGMDRVMIPTSYCKNQERAICLGDGYSSGDLNIYTTVPFVMPLKDLKGINIASASMQLFVDDFQSPSTCSKFRVWLNGKRFAAIEKILDGIDQSGPVGKLIYAKLSGDLLSELKKDNLRISIDDSTSYSPDGFAIDFIKLLVNPKPYPYTGNLNVQVMASNTGDPIPGATVSVPEFGEAKTDTDGIALIKNIYAGLAIADISAKGYISKTQSFDIIYQPEYQETYEVWLDLLETVTVNIDGRELKEGDALVLNNIQFKVNSAELQNEGRSELNKVVELMKQNPKIEIELSGHTSSEGDAGKNRKLSLDRVESCRIYLSDNGISEDRITALGYGPDKPIAPNDTEVGRGKNRRVEMKIVKIQ